MVKLDKPFDLVAVEVRRLLNVKDREAAKRLVLDTLATGRALPETQQLAVDLFDAKRGHPETGPERWIEIGHANYWLEAENIHASRRMSADERREILMERFGKSESHVRKCIRMYNRALRDGSE